MRDPIGHSLPGGRYPYQGMRLFFGDVFPWMSFLFLVFSRPHSKNLYGLDELEQMWRRFVPDAGIERWHWPESLDEAEEEIGRFFDDKNGILAKCQLRTYRTKGRKDRPSKLRLQKSNRFDIDIYRKAWDEWRRYMKFKHEIYVNGEDEPDGEGFWHTYYSDYTDRQFVAQQYAYQTIEIGKSPLTLSLPIKVGGREDFTEFLVEKDEDGYYIAEEIKNDEKITNAEEEEEAWKLL